MTTQTDPTSITIGGAKLSKDFPVRFSYLTVEEPRMPSEPKPGDKPKFSTVLIIKKNSPDVARIHDAMKAAHKAKGSPIANEDYDTLDLILRDGDNPKENKKKDPNLAGHYFMNASSNAEYPPGVVGKSIDPETGKLERLIVTVPVKGGKDGETVRKIKVDGDGQPVLRSGDYGAAAVKFYGYDQKGNKGIAARLENVQFRKRGEALAGGRSADDSFEADETDDGFLD